jgi:hypothetical protein
MRNEQSRHLRVVHSDSQAVAGDPGLSHLKDSIADPVSIPDANLIVGKTFDGEILSKLSVLEVISAKLALPIPVGLDLINHNGAVLTAVASEIGLAIALQIEPSSENALSDRSLPDRGANEFSLPHYLTWKTHIDGKQSGHWHLHWGDIHFTNNGSNQPSTSASVSFPAAHGHPRPRSCNSVAVIRWQKTRGALGLPALVSDALETAICSKSI